MNNENNKTLGCYVDSALYNQVIEISKHYKTSTSRLLKEIIKKFISGKEHEENTFFPIL